MTMTQYNVYPCLTPCRLVATSNQSGTYSNGQSNNGVGATFTYATGALTIDSVSVNLGDRILFQAQTNDNENGIYICTQAGATGVSAILQRSADQQNIEQLQLGQYVTISAGTLNNGSAFVLCEPLPAHLGVDDLVWNASPLNAGFGTAATKSASDDTKDVVASVAGASVLTNHIAVYADTAGSINDDAATAINGGNIQAGLPGTAGSLISFPGTTANGSLSLTAVNAGGAFNTVISNRAIGQSTTFSIGDPGQSTASILTSKVNADVGANLISFDVTVGQAALASGGSVTLIDSSGSKQYKLRELYLNSGGTNFSGGGGDRLGQVTDGTSVYSVVPAATMQSLVNAQWGVTALPNPVSVAINASTVAGADLVFKYSGGTTDYTAGSLVISGVVERVA